MTHTMFHTVSDHENTSTMFRNGKNNCQINLLIKLFLVVKETYRILTNNTVVITAIILFLLSILTIRYVVSVGSYISCVIILCHCIKDLITEDKISQQDVGTGVTVQ